MANVAMEFPGSGMLYSACIMRHTFGLGVDASRDEPNWRHCHRCTFFLWRRNLAQALLCAVQSPGYSVSRASLCERRRADLRFKTLRSGTAARTGSSILRVDMSSNDLIL